MEIQIGKWFLSDIQDGPMADVCPYFFFQMTSPEPYHVGLNSQTW